MRIIAGSHKGRVLHTPKGTLTRPTAQRTRQAIFDMLMHTSWYGVEDLQQADILDVFSGTGALALEGLSRGAKSASLIEQNPASLHIIRQNIRSCQFQEKTHIFHIDATRPSRAKKPHNLIFLDPPYHKNLINKALRALHHMGWLAPNALIIAESEDAATEEQPEGFQPFHAHLPPPLINEKPLSSPEILTQRRFGVARITIWRHQIEKA